MIKERPILFSTAMVQAILAGRKTQTRRVLKEQINGIARPGQHVCPYGQPGDILWVRETFGIDVEDDGFLYKANYDNADISWLKGSWKPSIHMPKEAARIWLEITKVRVERLNDINRGDCMGEGCPFPNIAKETDPKNWFSEIWKSINGPESWKENQWVWVVEFKRIDK